MLKLYFQTGLTLVSFLYKATGKNTFYSSSVCWLISLLSYLIVHQGAQKVGSMNEKTKIEECQGTYQHHIVTALKFKKIIFERRKAQDKISQTKQTLKKPM